MSDRRARVVQIDFSTLFARHRANKLINVIRPTRRANSHSVQYSGPASVRNIAILFANDVIILSKMAVCSVNKGVWCFYAQTRKRGSLPTIDDFAAREKEERNG